MNDDDDEAAAVAASFEEVFAAEVDDIAERRRVADGAAKAHPVPRHTLAGLALSGGGIRSATFCLGVLQGLRREGLLKSFDYLSTVSGGGYIGGWWSAYLARDAETGASPPRPTFPPDERIRPELTANSAVLLGGESGRSAYLDPTHHLRLFANYITPRKGALSADTWRAAAVVTRNLVLLWLVLLPILLAAILLAQLYFVVHPASGPAFLRPAAVTTAGALAAAPPPTMTTTSPSAAVPPATARVANADPSPAGDEQSALWQRFRGRAVAAGWALAAIGGLLVLMSVLWLVRLKRVPVDAGLLWCAAILWLVLARLGGGAPLFTGGFWGMPRPFIVWWVVAALLTGYALRTRVRDVVAVAKAWIAGVKGCWPVAGTDGGAASKAAAWARAVARKPKPAAGRSIGELHRNQIVRVHGAVLAVFAAVAAALVLGGIGHEIAAAVWGSVDRWARTAKWGTLLAAVAGTVWTAIQVAPVGGGDRRAEASGRTGAVSRVAMFVGPPVLMVITAFAIAWASHRAVGHLSRPDAARVWLPCLSVIGFGGAALAVWFAVREARRCSKLRGWPSDALFTALLFACLWCAAVACAVTYGVAISGWPQIPDVSRALLMTALVGGTVLLPVAGTHGGSSVSARFRTWARGERLASCVALAVATAIVAACTAWWIYGKVSAFYGGSATAAATAFGPPGPGALPDVFLLIRDPSPFSLAMLALAAVMLTAVGLLVTRRAGSRRPALLLGCAYVLLSCMLVFSLFRAPHSQGWNVAGYLDVPGTDARIAAAHAAVLLAAASLTWVLALGWTLDPNMLSMHTFYAARLTRAYLGASNRERACSPVEVTDAVAGDDVPLCELRNAQRGAPCHLINTTLNLVGGADLANGQRFSELFVLSKGYCGSLRSGYRPTGRYMGGRMTLGTAVAISGAAVSPAMGSITPSTATSMLLTAFNVRLGFWAPNPNRDLWDAGHPRLWPFYTLREFFSQTNDVSTYCYLTDGGHFDNTGVYALVQRACRVIVFVDCGADPHRSFQDVGNVIRRCRIDFGAQVDLDVRPFMPGADGLARRHAVVGTITYAADHLDAVRAGVRRGPRTGTIVWIKPSVTGDEPADVRQYAAQNRVFPQQATADQFYDEAQFESYRALGEESVQRGLHALARRGCGRRRDRPAGRIAAVKWLLGLRRRPKPQPATVTGGQPQASTCEPDEPAYAHAAPTAVAAGGTKSWRS